MWRTTAAGNAALAMHGQTAHGLRITLLRATGAPSLRAAVVIVGVWLHPGRPADLNADTPVPRDRRAHLVPGEDVAAFTGIEVELQPSNSVRSADSNPNEVIEASDGYAARELLRHHGTQSSVTDGQSGALTDLQNTSGLGAGVLPEPLPQTVHESA